MSAILRSFSHFSLLSALPKVKPLVQSVKEAGYKGLALTDEDTLSGQIELYSACKEAEIKPVYGVQIRLPTILDQDTEADFKGQTAYTKVTVLARNESGRLKLNEITTLVKIEYDQPKPHIPLARLQDFFDSSDLYLGICGSDSELLDLSLKQDLKSVNKLLQHYIEIFKAENLFCELMVPSRSISEAESKTFNLSLIKICSELGVLYVASPAPRYLRKDDSEAFRTLLAIRDRKEIHQIDLERDFSLPTLQELESKFAYAPQAIKNIDKILDSIENTFETRPIADVFPFFEIPEYQEYNQTLLWETLIGFVHKFDNPKDLDRSELRLRYPYESCEDLKNRVLGLKIDTNQLHSYPRGYWKNIGPREYVDRIMHEIKIITDKGYPTYFLIVADFIQYARENDIVVNTRGSAAGSLVAYLIGITNIDPLLYTIPFERFLNPMRPSAPDIDADIADDKRDEIIKYVTHKYGHDKVCQIITFGTMLPRMAVRDVGRALGVSYRKCDRIAKLIPLGKQGSKMTFDKALQQSQELSGLLESDEDAQQILNICRKLEGNHRHASVHAAGIIITPTKLTDYTSLQWDSDRKGVVCQLDMNAAEKVGLVKMDFLGIRNLSTLGNTIKLVENRHNTKINLDNLNLHSKRAFEMLTRGRTMGIFQLSGVAITKFLIDLKPSRVEDLMAMVALYRPGPMSNISEYIKRKHNPKLTHYYVPQMEKWMKDSYGILVYQDDLLYTVIELAGYDWAEVDVFRKGVGKKIRAVIDSQHEKFVDQCQSHAGLSKDTAEFVWSVMEPFASYGFNKAHSASYGMVAYWTAYLKGEYTVEFMTTLMTEESHNLEKVANAIKECNALDIKVLPPDINDSGSSFTIVNEKQIRYGFASIKNLGSDTVRDILSERAKNGKYTSLENLLSRISNYNTMNKRSLEALIQAGALDNLIAQDSGIVGLIKKHEFYPKDKDDWFIFCRSFLIQNSEIILEKLSAFKQSKLFQSTSLFEAEELKSLPKIVWNLKIEVFVKQQILYLEKNALGVYLSDDPMRDYAKLETVVQKLVPRLDLHLALVIKIKKIFTKKNSLMFAMQVITPTGNYEAVIFPKNALALSARLAENKMFWIKGKIILPKPKEENTGISLDLGSESVQDLMYEVEEQLDVDTEVLTSSTEESTEQDLEPEDSNISSDMVVNEYEESPKILVDNLVPFEAGVIGLIPDTLASRKHISQIKLLENLDWQTLIKYPDKFKDLSKKAGIDHFTASSQDSQSRITDEAKSSSQESVEIGHAVSSNQKSLSGDAPQKNAELTQIKLSMQDGANKLAFVRNNFRQEIFPGCVEVELWVEKAPQDWKKVKQRFYALPEQLVDFDN